MNKKQYHQIGQALKPYRPELLLQLWKAAVDCSNIETDEQALRNLTRAIADAFDAFLQDHQCATPIHLGHILNQSRATPIFLTQMNKTMRNLCLHHLEDNRLIIGLEAVADFFALIVQTYVQENQSLLKLESINEQAKAGIKSSLTDVEIMVLSHLIEGKTNKQIATMMDVSERTVVNYLKNIRHKIGTHNRSETIVMAIRLFNF